MVKRYNIKLSSMIEKKWSSDLQEEKIDKIQGLTMEWYWYKIWSIFSMVQNPKFILCERYGIGKITTKK